MNLWNSHRASRKMLVSLDGPSAAFVICPDEMRADKEDEAALVVLDIVQRETKIGFGIILAPRVVWRHGAPRIIAFQFLPRPRIVVLSQGFAFNPAMFFCGSQNGFKSLLRGNQQLEAASNTRRPRLPTFIHRPQSDAPRSVARTKTIWSG